jgi:UDP-N-acetylglucosamine:LPS N-acetylglucosamine transferase
MSVEEVAHIIRSLLNDAERLKALSARAREVAKGSAMRGSRGGLMK